MLLAVTLSTALGSGLGPWRAHSTLVLAGSLIYLVVGVTAAVNVPKT